MRGGGPGRPRLPSLTVWSVSGIVIKNNIFTASRFFRHACVPHADPSSVRCRGGTGRRFLVPDPVRKAGHVEWSEDGLPSLPVLPGPAVLTGRVDDRSSPRGDTDASKVCRHQEGRFRMKAGTCLQASRLYQACHRPAGRPNDPRLCGLRVLAASSVASPASEPASGLLVLTG